MATDFGALFARALFRPGMVGCQQATWGTGGTQSAYVHLFPVQDIDGASVGRAYTLACGAALSGVVIGSVLTINGVRYTVAAGPYVDAIGHATYYLDEAR